MHKGHHTSYHNTHLQNLCVIGESMKIIYYHTNLNTLTTLQLYILPVLQKKEKEKEKKSLWPNSLMVNENEM